MVTNIRTFAGQAEREPRFVQPEVKGSRVWREGLAAVGVADEERDWVRRARQGDAHAYRRLVECYQARIYRLVAGLLGHEQGNIDDVVQEVFIKAYFSLKRFREEASFATWIYRIAVNQARDEMRKASRRVSLSLDTTLAVETVQGLRGLWNRAEDDEDDLVASEALQRFVSQAVTALPEKLRTVVTLKDLEGLSYQEVGQILKCSVGTVKSRHSRARERLRTLLAPHLPELRTEGSLS